MTVLSTVLLTIFLAVIFAVFLAIFLAVDAFLGWRALLPRRPGRNSKNATE
jgi:MFS superfamily sulfate permease-like transporter